MKDEGGGTSRDTPLSLLRSTSSAHKDSSLSRFHILTQLCVSLKECGQARGHVVAPVPIDEAVATLFVHPPRHIAFVAVFGDYRENNAVRDAARKPYDFGLTMLPP